MLNSLYACSQALYQSPRYKKLSARGLSYLILILLSGCSIFEAKPPSPIPEQQSWSDTSKELALITRWSLTGKIGVRTANESFTAAINNWQQARDSYAIDLSSTFFGLGATRLLGDTDMITIIESGEEPLSSYEPERLLKEALGFPLPLGLLIYWAKGIAADNLKYNIEYNEVGLPQKLTQAGWTINYSKHRYYDGLPLPHKIKLTNDQTRIILAIKEWKIARL